MAVRLLQVAVKLLFLAVERLLRSMLVRALTDPLQPAGWIVKPVKWGNRAKNPPSPIIACYMSRGYKCAVLQLVIFRNDAKYLLNNIQWIML